MIFEAAAEEYLRHLEHDRERKPSTLRDYRSIIAAHLLTEFGDMAVEDLTAESIEAWSARLPVANRTKVKILTILNGVLERARRQYRLPRNPMTDGGDAQRSAYPRRRSAVAAELRAKEEPPGP